MGRSEDCGAEVLGFVGSPRKGGNTDLLVDEVLAGAVEGGASAGKVFLADHEVRPCRSCMGCLSKKRCVQKDDMQGLTRLMDGARSWVLGTPVWWWGPSAQFKLFVDRWFGAARSIGFKGRKAVVVMPLGDTNKATARHAKGMLLDALGYLGVEVVSTVIAPGCGDAGDVAKYAKVLEAARKAGRKLAK